MFLFHFISLSNRPARRQYSREGSCYMIISWQLDNSHSNSWQPTTIHHKGLSKNRIKRFSKNSLHIKRNTRSHATRQINLKLQQTETSSVRVHYFYIAPCKENLALANRHSLREGGRFCSALHSLCHYRPQVCNATRRAVLKRRFRAGLGAVVTATQREHNTNVTRIVGHNFVKS